MDFIQQVQVWTRGEIEQGKWMLAISILLLSILFLLLKSENVLSRGMLIPLSVLFLIIAGYGTYLVMGRKGYSERIENQFQQNAGQTIESQYQKAKQDDKTYTLLKGTWAVMVIASILLYFFTNQYYKGLSLGFAVMFLGLLVTDTFLYNRFKQYFTALERHAGKTELFLLPTSKKEVL